MGRINCTDSKVWLKFWDKNSPSSSACGGELEWTVDEIVQLDCLPRIGETVIYHHDDFDDTPAKSIHYKIVDIEYDLERNWITLVGLERGLKELTHNQLEDRVAELEEALKKCNTN